MAFITSLLYFVFFFFISDHNCHGRAAPRWSSSWSRRRHDVVWGQRSLRQELLLQPYDELLPPHQQQQHVHWLSIRGGEADTTITSATENDVDAATTPVESSEHSNNKKASSPTLDQRVRAALQKFGLVPPPPSQPENLVVDVGGDNDQATQIIALNEASNDKTSFDVEVSAVSDDTDASSSMATSTIATPTAAEVDNKHGEQVITDKEDLSSLASTESPPTVSDTTTLSKDETASLDSTSASSSAECENGVCSLPSESAVEEPAVVASTTASSPSSVVKVNDASDVLNDQDYFSMAQKIASDMAVHSSLAMAALIATRPDDDNSNTISKSDHLQAARTLIEQELERINQIQQDAPEVKQLVSEGYDAFLSRRALAFAEMNMDDARAILLADQLDEEEELEKVEQAKRDAAANSPEAVLEEQPLITVPNNFDPTKLSAVSQSTNPQHANPKPQEPAMPQRAKKSDVVFEATAAQVQELVLESPVPVLLDVYADWCGPCKALGPALEEMAVKAGGAFRLVKINSDRERVISTALEVTALPTVFGIRDGQIVHMFQGIPRSDDFMKNFMMNLLVPGYSTMDPPITDQEKKKYADSTMRLAKMAGAACWPFAARERLQDRVLSRLDALVKEAGGMAQADDSAKILRSLLSNVIRDPFQIKFRTVNLANKALAQKVTPFPSAVGVLRAVGFSDDSKEASSRLSLKPQQKVINVAPLVVARDCIDKWIDKNRYEIAVAARKRKDELDRARLAEEAAANAAAAAEAGGNASEVDDAEDEDENALPPNSCTIKIRLEGKKKIHNVVLNGDEPLQALLEALPSTAGIGSDTEYQLTCAAKRLIIKSSDQESMSKSLVDHGLLPMASFVVKRIQSAEGEETVAKAVTGSKSRLSQRAAVKKSRKKGSHTMQSIGIYAKDDNNKAELIDGGGGVWYEHDVSDDEGETPESPPTNDKNAQVDDNDDGGQTMDEIDDADSDAADEENDTPRSEDDSEETR